jgi:hypothetical protein
MQTGFLLGGALSWPGGLCCAALQVLTALGQDPLLVQVAVQYVWAKSPALLLSGGGLRQCIRVTGCIRAAARAHAQWSGNML